MGADNKASVLKLLREHDRFVSGQELCQDLGISRAAVWKIINRLKEEGYQIMAVTNKGYYLEREPEDSYSKSTIESRLTSKWVGSKIIFKECTGSTNADMKQLAEEGEAHGTVEIADKQEAGRGRRGKVWESPAGENIFFSLLLRPKFPPDRASCLTIVMALAVTKAIEKETSLRPGIKWPNDIVYDKKKICGILTEMSAEVDFIQYVVIGSGINVNMNHIPEEIRDHAASLHKAYGRKINRSQLLAQILYYFEKYYEIYCDTLDLSKLKEEYESYLVSKDKEVRVLDPKETFCGISTGINNQGELMVKKSDGEIVKIYAGEVSVRGVYGYV